MSETFHRIQTLVLAGDYAVSDHGFDELEEDDILASELIDGIATAVEIEDYPDRLRGPSVLVLHRDGQARPVHVVWGIPVGERRPAVLVTAYRPEPSLWDSDFRQRIE
jgi:hypothetical protein